MSDHQFFMSLGFSTKATLIASPSNNIENWTKQSDQGSRYPWTIPDRDLTTRPALRSQVDLMQDGSQFDFQYFEFVWGFKFWTYGQFKYLMSNFTLGTRYLVTGRYQDVTVQTLVSDGAYEALQCRMLLPREGEDFSKDINGLVDLKLRFVSGVVLEA
jgi:hypothetical protein